jgi:hypothetical protein
MATQLARRSTAPTTTRRTGISVAKAEALARSAKAGGARAAKAMMRQKALMVSIPSAAVYGAIEDRLPNMVGLGLPGGKRLVPGLGLAIAGAFMGGSLGETAMLVGLGPACAGAADFGKSFSGAAAASTTMAGLEDVAVAGLRDIAVAGEDDDDVPERYRNL